MQAVGDKVEGFGFASENVGTKVLADCDRGEVPPADAEVDSVVDGGEMEGVKLTPSLVGIGVVVGR